MSQENREDSTYSAIMRVYGSAIHLWPHNGLESKTKDQAQSFKIYCHDRETRSEDPDIRVFVLPGKDVEMDKCVFDYQKTQGQLVNQSDLAIFMAAPKESSRKATYALDLSVPKQQSLEDHSQPEYSKIGTVYLYLDTEYSTQGVQRMQIIGSHNMKPIGQMQIEYLIVRNPHAYGVDVPRPNWLTPYKQLDAGHRGAGSGCRSDLQGSITENTVASFNYAARHGADMCELDVMCTKDGVPVVYHNYTLDTSKPGSTQIDELTLEELRNLQNVSIHDKNCPHNLDTSPDALSSKSCRPFPTLAEVLQEVDETCALNIELKWPQLLPNGKSEAIQYREINDGVDRVLACIDEHANGRDILLSTMNANVAIMLRLKQSQYPVLFLTTGDSTRFNDQSTKSFRTAIHFALAFEMAGVNPNAAYLTQDLVHYAQDRGLLIYVWGKIESPQAVRDLKRTGVDGVIYDKIDLIKPTD